MNKHSISSIIICIFGTILFTALLSLKLLTPVVYGSLMVSLALVCVAIVCLPRLSELDLKNLRITLAELKKVKAEIEVMYGGIENIRSTKYVLDERRIENLGLKYNKNAIPNSSIAPAMMRYIVGCIKRERERLARVFINPKEGEKLAEAILDGTYDDGVFTWAGPESKLDKTQSEILSKISEDER
jgi:hypothetical protein